jgi:hypothetical protein
MALTTGGVNRERLLASGPEERFQRVGRVLADSIRAVTEAVPGDPRGPAEVARVLGIDKVLASRVLKATRNADPIAALHVAPGPEPLRRFLRAAGKHGAPSGLLDEAEAAVRSFEILIRQEAGDRSGLDAILSAWLPEARAAFELRRKQAAFRALSQLQGVETSLFGSTAILHPSEDGAHIDVVWLFGLFGLMRHRPGSRVKFATRRFSVEDPERFPRTLGGEQVAGLDGLRLDAFCSSPPPDLDVHRIGDVVQYSLADSGYGLRSACDLVFAEVNLGEMPRYIPREQKRKRHVFAEISVPTKLLVFDALVHEAIFAGRDPGLEIYDTSFEGVADPNDRLRDMDRLDMSESIQSLGSGSAKFRSSDEPRHADLLQHVWQSLGWNGDEFRGYRCRISYPVYGSQVVMTWDSEP